MLGQAWSCITPHIRARNLDMIHMRGNTSQKLHCSPSRRRGLMRPPNFGTDEFMNLLHHSDPVKVVAALPSIVSTSSRGGGVWVREREKFVKLLVNLLLRFNPDHTLILSINPTIKTNGISVDHLCCYSIHPRSHLVFIMFPILTCSWASSSSPLLH